MNQSQRIDELTRLGWWKLMPDNEYGWKFYARRDRRHTRLIGYDYLTVFRNGRTADGVVETRYQREKRKQREILFRDFRNYPNWR